MDTNMTSSKILESIDGHGLAVTALVIETDDCIEADTSAARPEVEPVEGSASTAEEVRSTGSSMITMTESGSDDDEPEDYESDVSWNNPAQLTSREAVAMRLYFLRYQLSLIQYTEDAQLEALGEAIRNALRNRKTLKSWPDQNYRWPTMQCDGRVYHPGCKRRRQDPDES
ncbi:MAG: hypothetical protein J3Q66DRAFT_332519 [Benniella sp.]|nr:MAG: hypothetical protein J3Q66DRAFT_332519 [Benniella sp.]